MHLQDLHLYLQGPPAHALNWSQFKPGFFGGSDEDHEAPLLRTSNWMNTHASLHHVKCDIIRFTQGEDWGGWQINLEGNIHSKGTLKKHLFQI